MKKTISVVIPAYNEEKNLPLMRESLEKIFEKLSYEYEIIFVNDGSTDGSLDVLKKMARKDSRIKILDFSRNFGKEVAISAGCHAAGGDAIITMDADLQHPPRLIKKFLALWENGAEVVYTVRKENSGARMFKKISSRLFYWIFNKISDMKSESGTTDFRLMDRKVIEVFRTFPERERMFRGLIDWMGFHRVKVEFTASQRVNGSPAYSYSKLFRLAMNSFTSFSLFPLRVAGYLGVCISSVSGLVLFFMLFSKLWDPGLFTPVAILAISNVFLVGIVLISLGLIALYIARIHTEVSGRPLYIVREKINVKE